MLNDPSLDDRDTDNVNESDDFCKSSDEIKYNMESLSHSDQANSQTNNNESKSSSMD